MSCQNNTYTTLRTDMFNLSYLTNSQRRKESYEYNGLAEEYLYMFHIGAQSAIKLA
jgi:hypothetical protein